MRTIGIIPARMSSTRFPGKPLAEIHGIPMIGHIYKRCILSKKLDAVYIATCDQEIADYAKSINAPCVMTADTHQRATDRVAEAIVKIENITGEKFEIIVMAQGDEPMIFPEMIDDAIEPLLADATLNIVNTMAKFTSAQEFEDPNAVKVVMNNKQEALYFSREPIPSRKKFDGEIPMYKQLGLIVFRKDYLLKFNQLPETPLEIIESVDMMRVLEHGDKIQMINTTYRTFAVDTPSDLIKVTQAMENDSLMQSYNHQLETA